VYQGVKRKQSRGQCPVWTMLQFHC